MAPIGPPSYADSTQPFATDISLSLYFDFLASALLSLPRPFAGTLVLDTRDLSFHSVTDPASGSSFPFTLSPPHPILGSRLSVSLPTASSSVLITYSTSPSSSALQWLSPPQTTLGKSPFVFTQCQANHARAVCPCQDTPPRGSITPLA